MRRSWKFAPVLALALAGAADGALTTGSLDAVEAEVAARKAALTKPYDKTEKKQLKALEIAGREFRKRSRNETTDAARIRKIVRTLAGAYPDDAAMAALLDAGLDAWLAGFGAEMTHVKRCHAALDPSNRRRSGADRSVAKAETALADATAQTSPVAFAGSMGAVVKWVNLAHKATDKALEVETTLTAHEDAFLRELPGGYVNADDCISCHQDAGPEMLASRHWRWKEAMPDVEGLETGEHGKIDLINNFCISVPSNEPRCVQCHIGYDWKNKSFDFTDTSKIDCLICHDTTGTYKKDPKLAGAPVAGTDLQAVAMNVGRPGRANCGFCHYGAGGGDNVKKGDMASSLNATDRANDVHMGTNGANMACQDCHGPADTGAPASPAHAAMEAATSCERCHDDAPHQSATLNQHTARVACETCHIPAFSRVLPTKVSWDWSTAGDKQRTVVNDAHGKPDYDPMKGDFVWAKNVVPALRWSNGSWRRKALNVNDTYTTLPAVLAEPVGSRGDPASKIRPFKKMVGRQPADVVNKRFITPHLFGTGPGPKPYWAAYDWAAAMAEGAAYAAQVYSGTYGFVETEMYLGIHHEVAPKEQALGCASCHNGGIDFEALGYPGDPWYVK